MLIQTDDVIVRETYVDATRDAIFGDNEISLRDCYFAGDETTDTGDVYRYGRDEWGRCIGRVYVDTDAGTLPCGWVYQSRQRYEDTGEPYVREVWLQLVTETPRLLTPVRTA